MKRAAVRTFPSPVRIQNRARSGEPVRSAPKPSHVNPTQAGLPKQRFDPAHICSYQVPSSCGMPSYPSDRQTHPVAVPIGIGRRSRRLRSGRAQVKALICLRIVGVRSQPWCAVDIFAPEPQCTVDFQFAIPAENQGGVADWDTVRHPAGLNVQDIQPCVPRRDH